MEYVMILNAVSVIACSAAIATACKVTGSAWPLLAFVLIPNGDIVILTIRRKKMNRRKIRLRKGQYRNIRKAMDCIVAKRGTRNNEFRMHGRKPLRYSQLITYHKRKPYI